MQQNEQHSLINHVPCSITGRRIAKSNIQINISRQYSVTSFINIHPSTMNIPFELKKQNTNLIKPQILERVETLKQAVYRTQSFFER
jgi:hypothetical protein